MTTSLIKKAICGCLFSCLAIFSFEQTCLAQAGSVYTVAGGGTSDADGVPATSASIAISTGMGMDAAGNFYYADRGLSLVRKVNGGSGLVYTVAGGSTSSFSGDGGPATAAGLSDNIRGLHVTPSGDIYISDDTRIRKVSGASGIITTVAGGGSSTADGVPATSEAITVNCVYVDVAGNIYFGTDNKIKKVNAGTGIITTIAGNGTSGDTGDGGPATAAGMYYSAKSICADNAGNLYLISFTGDRIRKINGATGIISTVAGGGSSTAEGIPATSASFVDFHNCRVDGAGNIFIADWNRGLIRRVDAATGIINTIAGVEGGGSYAEGCPALSASINPYMILVNPSSGNIYYSNFGGKVKKFTYSPMTPLFGGGSSGTYASDSFYINIYKQCTGPDLTIRTNSYHPGLTVRTNFGDGAADTSAIGVSWSGIGSFALVNHTYPTSGTYTITHVLCNSGVPVDTLTYSYEHIFCADMSVRFYNDIDHNCIKATTEPYLMKQVITEVDSNGTPVDTIAATSGFNYLAYGTPGDIYKFKILSTPAGLYTSCPAPGIVYDTLHAGITTNAPRLMALACTAGSTIDLEASAYVPVTGPNDQWGHIYLCNNYCLPVDASVTLNFSPKYRYMGDAHPSPLSSTPTSITWGLSALSSAEPTPSDIYFVVWHNPVVPYPIDGDTVKEHIMITSIGTTDANPSNNIVIRNDTVNTSCDPNAMEVLPACFESDTTFHFTVHFENIGSAPAVNIYVRDTLSDYFDPSTFSIDKSTHPMFVTKYVADNRTIFKFDFPNINLADSSDHVNRDGMFMYTIRNKASIPIPNGVAITSNAGIYFDYNDVLMTNTASTIKGCPKPSTQIVATEIATFTLYPNPATDELVIREQHGMYSRFSIANMLGQTLVAQDLQQPQTNVSIKGLNAGMYYVTLEGLEGRTTKKFVKQ